MGGRLPDSGAPKRLQLRPPRKLSRLLLRVGYPADRYPEVESLQDAYQRAAGDIIRQRLSEFDDFESCDIKDHIELVLEQGCVDAAELQQAVSELTDD